jgi:putative sterol carrier protein
MGGLQIERLAGAISGYASSEAALSYAMQYMAERNAFGRPINKFQVLRHRVAQLASEIEMLKQFVLHCCRLNNDGIYAVKECSMAKLLSTELAEKVMTQCLQFFGGYGYMEDYKMARMFRDSRIGTIGGGTSEIMREIIAKMVIDDVSYEKAGNSISGEKAESSTKVSLDSLLPKIRRNAEKAKPLGKSLKFDFGDKQLVIDGTGTANTITTENRETDCSVNVELSDFISLIKGELNPMTAMMNGKIKITGDMGVAMKLQSLFA